MRARSAFGVSGSRRASSVSISAAPSGFRSSRRQRLRMVGSSRLRRRADQQQHGARRRFLERLEQRVLHRRLVGALGLVQHHDAPAALGGGLGQEAHRVARILHAQDALDAALAGVGFQREAVGMGVGGDAAEHSGWRGPPPAASLPWRHAPPAASARSARRASPCRCPAAPQISQAWCRRPDRAAASSVRAASSWPTRSGLARGSISRARGRDAIAPPRGSPPSRHRSPAPHRPRRSASGSAAAMRRNPSRTRSVEGHAHAFVAVRARSRGGARHARLRRQVQHQGQVGREALQRDRRQPAQTSRGSPCAPW